MSGGCCEHSRTVQKYMIYQIQHTTAPIVYHIGAGNDRQSKGDIMKKAENTALRVALYIRVSGEEQKIKGLSLEAQQERLEAYARERGWVIVGVFVDAAKTARKNIHKRTEFLRMMDLVKRDGVDLLLFCRLDRWFRSVADYYKVMEVLEAHACGWKTIDDGEGYDTTTASGRLYINLRLSIAQNEADLDGERIAVVFDSKINHGTVVSGSCPFWLRVNDQKRFEVIPEKAAILQDAFNHFEATISQRATVKYIRETYGVNWCDATFRRMLRDKLAIGVYDKNGRYNENFCEAVISPAQFERVQKLLGNNAKSTPTGRVFLFTSLLVCEECRHKLVGAFTKGYYYYRCNQYFQRGRCSHNKFIREDVVEKWLFDHLGEELEKYRLAWEVQEEKRRKAAASVDRAAVRRKLSRLKDLYVNDLIDIEEYKRDYDKYNAMLEEKPEPAADQRPDFAAIENLLSQDFKTIYDGLEREEKRTLWRSVISEIRMDNDQHVTGISFL